MVGFESVTLPTLSRHQSALTNVLQGHWLAMLRSYLLKKVKSNERTAKMNEHVNKLEKKKILFIMLIDEIVKPDN